MTTTVLIVVGLAAGTWWFAAVRNLPSAGVAGRFAGGVAAAAAERTVSVVVPARDEALSLPALLGSLQRSSVPPGEVVVVDDASTDGTAAVAAKHGATVVRLDDSPPPGWTGKAYACARGAEAATGSLLLFLDADVVLADDGIDRLLDAHGRLGGLISVQPHHRVERPYEELSATCNVVAMMGSGAFAVWPPPRPVGYGPCMLTSAADYATVGGHAAVRGEVIEDTRLARRYATAGLPVNAFAGGASVSFRMYPDGLRQLVDGWTKSLAAGAAEVSLVAVVASVAWVTACLAAGLRGISVAVRPGAVDAGDALIAIGGWLAVTLQLRWMLQRIGSFGWVTSILHPLPMWAFVALFGRSLWLTLVRRRVRWRGRHVTVGAGNRD